MTRRTVQRSRFTRVLINRDDPYRGGSNLAGPSRELLAAGAAVLSSNSDDPDVLRTAAATALGRPLTDDDMNSVNSLLGSLRARLDTNVNGNAANGERDNEDIMPTPPIMPPEEQPPIMTPEEEPPIMPAEDQPPIMTHEEKIPPP